MQKLARHEETQDIAMSKMTDRWLEPKNDYEKLKKCSNLTRVDLVGYSIEIRFKSSRKMMLDMKEVNLSRYEAWKWWRHEEMKMPEWWFED